MAELKIGDAVLCSIPDGIARSLVSLTADRPGHMERLPSLGLDEPFRVSFPLENSRFTQHTDVQKVRVDFSLVFEKVGKACLGDLIDERGR